MKAWSLLLLVALPLALGTECHAADPILLRVESLTVLPNSQPMLYVRVMNSGNASFQGKVTIDVPDTWRISSTLQEVELAPGQSRRLSFSVSGGRELTSNSYRIEVSAIGRQQRVSRRQNIAVASAPYFKPTIDGDPSEWKDAIPVAFVVDGKKTTVRTYWNRRSFSILVAVQEDRLIRAQQGSAPDAIQLALAPGNTRTPRSTFAKANRFEYLLVARDEKHGTCYQLMAPGAPLAEAAKDRSLESLEYAKADLAISRKDGVTYYECRLPFAPMRTSIRPSEGRAFFLSVLVHDPDGTGIRDWGEAAGLWESQRNRLAWSRWTGARWKDKPPMDCRTEWGLCSSRY